MMDVINGALLRMSLAISGLRARLSEQGGQTLVEYGLLTGLIALAIVLGFVAFSDAVGEMTSGIAECIGVARMVRKDGDSHSHIRSAQALANCLGYIAGSRIQILDEKKTTATLLP